MFFDRLYMFRIQIFLLLLFYKKYKKILLYNICLKEAYFEDILFRKTYITIFHLIFR